MIDTLPPLHQFLQMMAAERKATRSTLSAYEADLRDVYKFFKDQPIEDLTARDIQDYLLTQKHLAPATVGRRLSTLGQFYTFLIGKDVIKENPLSSVKTPSYKSKSPPVNGEDVTRLLRGAKAWAGPEGKRLSLLLQLFSISDISVDELVSLPLDVGRAALKTEKPFLTLPANRIVPLTEAALDALRTYMMVHNQESHWLFPSSSQKGHLTRQRFGQLLKELALKVELDPAQYSLSTIRQGFRNVSHIDI